VKTSVTLPNDLLDRIDREGPIDKARRDRGGAAILEKAAAVSCSSIRNSRPRSAHPSTAVMTV
jgi:hypothetical protein